MRDLTCKEQRIIEKALINSGKPMENLMAPKGEDMKLSAMGAIDLQTEIERADFYKEDYGSATVEALQEVQRLRTICQEIIEVIGTEYAQGTVDADFCIEKIDNIAHRYFKP